MARWGTTARAVALAGALAPVMFLVGCGFSLDGGSSSSAQSAAPTTTAAPSQPPALGLTATPAPGLTVTPAPGLTGVPVPPASGVPVPKASGVPVPKAELSTPPHTYAEALAHIAAGRPVGGGFQTTLSSPTGGIYCVLDQDGANAACELTRTRLGAHPGSGVVDCQTRPPIGRIEMGDSAARAVCNADTIVNGTAPTLAYGTIAENRDAECVMERIGVTCVDRNASGVGFFLSAEAYEIF